MATSYGSITIVDITDIGEFSVYPTANSPRTQIYNPDTNTYTPDWSGSNPDTSLKITPVAYYASQNVSTAATYVWKRRDGAGNLTDLGANESVITVSGNTGVLKVNNNVLANSTSGIISYVVTAHYTVDGVQLEAVGEIDFSLTRQGTTAKTAKITGENIFKYNSEGSLTPSGKTITLTGTVAGVSITGWQYKSGNSWSTYPNSDTSTSLTISPSDAVFSNDSATIKLVTSDNSVYDLITITKLYDGTKGDAVVSAVLTNEDQMLPADKNGNVTSFSGAETELIIYEGGRDVTSTWTITKESTNVTDSAVHTYEATITGISADTGYVTFTCRKSGYDTIVKKFSLVKVKTGQDGTTPVIYSLDASTVVVNTDPINEGVHPNPSPSQVVFNAYQQTGNALPSAYAGRIQFYIDDNSTITDATSTDASTRTINFNNSPWNAANRVKAVLYQAGANTTQLDSQTVVIVCDGVQGQNGNDGPAGPGAVNVILGNEADVIPCDSANHPIPNGTGTDANNFIIDIPYEGYQGITVKTTAVSAPSIPTSDTGLSSAIAADTSVAGHVKYKIPNTATLIEGGSINLTFTVSVDSGGTVNVSKKYTWTRSSAAINGINAVILQTVAEDGTIFENNGGTLYAKAILYNGADEATGETYTWYQYKNGQYKIVNTTNTPNVVTGHGTKNASTGVWSWTNSNNGTTSSDMIKIEAGAVDGYASFKIVSAYTVNGSSKSYTQYISFIDKSDPVQVSLHSTVGTQIKNSQGVGCIYARVTRSGTELDPVPQGIQAGIAYPSDPSTNDYFVLLSTNNDHTLRTAKLYKYNGSAWSAVSSTCSYTWYFRNSNNVPITTGVPYQDTSNRTNNQFIYIDADLINSKIIIDCEVTVN